MLGTFFLLLFQLNSFLLVATSGNTLRIPTGKLLRKEEAASEKSQHVEAFLSTVPIRDESSIPAIKRHRAVNVISNTVAGTAVKKKKPKRLKRDTLEIHSDTIKMNEIHTVST